MVVMWYIVSFIAGGVVGALMVCIGVVSARASKKDDGCRNNDKGRKDD